MVNRHPSVNIKKNKTKKEKYASKIGKNLKAYQHLLPLM